MFSINETKRININSLYHSLYGLNKTKLIFIWIIIAFLWSIILVQNILMSLT